jgi:hypothetical protein
MTLAKNSKIGLSAFLLLCGAGGLYVFMYQYIGQRMSELDDLRVAKTANDARAQSEQDTKTFIQNTTEEQRELNSYLVDVDNPTPFLSLLEELARDVQVLLDVESLSAESPSTNKNSPSDPIGMKHVTAVLKVEGSWEHVHHLLSLIEHMPYLVTVERMTIARENTSGMWVGQVHLRVMALK